MSLSTTIVTALGLAAAAYIIPRVMMESSRYALAVAVWLSMAWVSISVYAVAQYHRRGLWVLLGLVPALWWLFILAALRCGGRLSSRH